MTPEEFVEYTEKMRLAIFEMQYRSPEPTLTPQEFAAYREKQILAIGSIRNQIDQVHKIVDGKLPANLRPATTDDIKPGAIIWYKEGDEGPFWKIIDYVLSPNGTFKAYVADDGSRYGLDDAWVKL